jgi:hypothetical protein
LEEPHSEVGSWRKLKSPEHFVVGLLSANQADSFAFWPKHALDPLSSSFCIMMASFQSDQSVRVTHPWRMCILINSIEVNVVLKDLNSKIESVCLNELLLKTDCHLTVCFCGCSVGALWQIEILIGKEGI